MDAAGLDSRTWKRRSVLWLVGLLGLSLAGLPLALVKPPFGIIAYLVMVVGMAAAIVRWHTRNTAFRCAGCEQVFTVPGRTFLWSLNLGMRKLLVCPGCRRHDWCRAVPREPATIQVREEA